MNYLKPYVIICGGLQKQNMSDFAFAFDTSKPEYKWEKFQLEMPPRYSHSSCVITRGTFEPYILVHGGCDNDKNVFSDFWQIQFSKNLLLSYKIDVKIDSLVPDTFQLLGRQRHTINQIGNELMILGGCHSKENLKKQTFVTFLQLDQNNMVVWEVKKSRFVPFCHQTIFDKEQKHIYVYGGGDRYQEKSHTKEDINSVYNHLMWTDFQELQDNKSSSLYSFLPSVVSRNLSKLDVKPENFIYGNATPIAQSNIINDGPTRLHNEFLINLMKPEQFSQNSNLNFQIESSKSIITLILETKEIIKQQPPLLEISSPVKVFGDIHGQFSDLMRHFHLFGAPFVPGKEGDIEQMDYLFLGDYVDRGQHSIEVMIVLMSLKIKFPNQIHLLRGNHEDLDVSSQYGFYTECERKFPQNQDEDTNTVFQAFIDLFQYMSVAAIINNKIFCCHGGIGKSLTQVDFLNTLKKPINVESNMPEQLEEKIISDLLWSDPVCEETGQAKNNRGEGTTTFDLKDVELFLKENNLKKIIRAHEVVMNGYDVLMEGQVITVFSATNYCGKYQNAGAILYIDKSLTITPQFIKPIQSKEDGQKWENSCIEKHPPTPLRNRTFKFETFQ